MMFRSKLCRHQLVNYLGMILSALLLFFGAIFGHEVTGLVTLFLQLVWMFGALVSFCFFLNRSDIDI